MFHAHICWFVKKQNIFFLVSWSLQVGIHVCLQHVCLMIVKMPPGKLHFSYGILSLQFRPPHGKKVMCAKNVIPRFSGISGECGRRKHLVSDRWERFLKTLFIYLCTIIFFFNYIQNLLIQFIELEDYLNTYNLFFYW